MPRLLVRHRSVGRALLAAAAVVGLTAACTGSTSPAAQGGGDASPSAAAAPVTVAFTGQTGNTVPFGKALALSVTDGTITSVTATGPGGSTVTGTVTPTGWTMTGIAAPSSVYTVHADVTDSAGGTSTVDKTVTTTAATSLLHPTISPGSGTVGVGAAVIVRFDKKVYGKAARLAVEKGLAVTSTPSQPGAWHWYNSYEVHYRAPAYWKAGTKVSVKAALGAVNLPGTETWGTTKVATAGFTVGDQLISTVDVTAHNMVVRKNGKIIDTFPVSTGRTKYPTKGGIHVVLLKEAVHTYNSATVGIPVDGPDGYYEKLPWSVRISNGGAFVHANPATVGEQGRANVSHGCVNLSVSNAHAFFDVTHRGDIVNVIHAAVGPVTTDAGMADWNYSWATWKAGNLGT